MFQSRPKPYRTTGFRGTGPTRPGDRAEVKSAPDGLLRSGIPILFFEFLTMRMSYHLVEVAHQWPREGGLLDVRLWW